MEINQGFESSGRMPKGRNTEHLLGDNSGQDGLKGN